jgi:hypothetical protein
MPRRSVTLAVFISLLGAAGAEEFRPEQLEFFEKQVRPILVKRCYECHSGEQKEPKGGLRVDSREALLRGGDTEPAIVPGNAKKSLLIDAINYGDTYQMPKKSKMPAEEIAILTRWVDDGAAWPPSNATSPGDAAKTFDLAARKAAHWCWRPLSSPAVPTVKNGVWPADTLDRFILARLEAHGVAPAASADKRTLLRRVYFDLVGLPPSREQVAAFVADESPGALAKVVDELLRSPQFGERWGRHWLDLVRYAESRGHEFDYNAPNAYQYRDYVIRALNADLPYNEFVVEQVAGDLLEQPRLNSESGSNESILGTGFWFLGEWVHSPVDIRKDECDRFDNMVDVFSKTFLGLTVSCARCHDHKFDAVSQKDYYALFGYLQSSSYRLVRFDTMQQEARLANELDELNQRFGPEIEKAVAASQQQSLKDTPDYLLAVREVLQRKLSGEALVELAKAKTLDPARLAKWVEATQAAAGRSGDLLHVWAKYCEAGGDDDVSNLERASQKVSEQWKTQSRQYEEARRACETIVDYSDCKPEQWFTNGPTFGEQPVKSGALLLGPDGVAGFAERGAARRDATWNVLRAAPGAERDPGRLGNIDRAGKTLKTPSFTIKAGLVHYLVRGLGHAYAALDSHSVIAGPLHNQIVVDFDKGNSDLRWISQDLRAYQGHRAHLEFYPTGDQPLEVLQVVQGERAPPLPLSSEVEGFDVASPFTLDEEKPTVESLAKQYGLLIGSRRAWLWKHAELITRDEEKLREIVARYLAERKLLTDQIKPESRYAMAMWDGSGEDETLMIRGNHRLTGAVVPRRMLEAVAGSEPATIEHGSGRLQLAGQLVDPQRNPFVPRVMVNRVWQHLFGRGLVPSVDNFGVLGQEPTHPELLDHLATRFVNDGWSIKRLIRSIVLSRTYQMASSPTDAQAEEADPKNLLWRRTNLRRLEAEAIRDQLLALSGRLDRTQFGPSVPVHLTPFMQGRGRPGDGPLDGNGRRSVYLSVRRNFLSPLMLAFDTPIPFSTMGARNVSNVPAQALILMNDPFVLQQAELWARKVCAEQADVDGRIAAMYESAFARPPAADELAAARAFLASQAKEYGLSPEAATSDVRPWTDLAHVLVNAKEFIFLK